MSTFNFYVARPILHCRDAITTFNFQVSERARTSYNAFESDLRTDLKSKGYSLERADVREFIEKQCERAQIALNQLRKSIREQMVPTDGDNDPSIYGDNFNSQYEIAKSKDLQGINKIHINEFVETYIEESRTAEAAFKAELQKAKEYEQAGLKTDAE